MGDRPPCFRANDNIKECRTQSNEAAHKIAATVVNIYKFGYYVVYCHLNMLPSCKPCNDYAMHFDSRQDKIDHILRIWEYLDKKELPYNKVDLGSIVF